MSMPYCTLPHAPHHGFPDPPSPGGTLTVINEAGQPVAYTTRHPDWQEVLDRYCWQCKAACDKYMQECYEKDAIVFP